MVIGFHRRIQALYSGLVKEIFIKLMSTPGDVENLLEGITQ